MTVRVYLGVRTCELFLCFVPFVFLGFILLTSLFSLFYVTVMSLTGSYTVDEPTVRGAFRITQIRAILLFISHLFHTQKLRSLIAIFKGITRWP